jgi:hypothetical protein
MQGYLTPNRLDLTIRQNRYYFHSQCGLCQQLKQDYGTFARFMVNRDALILQLLTEAQLQQTPIHQKIRCGVQPFLHSAKANLKAAQFAAAVTVMMFWGKLTDTIADAKWLSGFLSRHILWKNRHKIKKAENRLYQLGFDVKIIYDLFEQQQKREQSADLSGLEEVASPTAQGLAALFAHTAILANMPENIDILKHLGKEVGAMLYILDARDDLSADLKNQQFNPLILSLKNGVSNSLAEAETQATTFIRQKHQAANKAFSSFETRHHQEVLENIFSLGLQNHIERQKACRCHGRTKVGSVLRMRLAGDGGSQVGLFYEIASWINLINGSVYCIDIDSCREHLDYCVNCCGCCNDYCCKPYNEHCQR